MSSVRLELKEFLLSLKFIEDCSKNVCPSVVDNCICFFFFSFSPQFLGSLKLMRTGKILQYRKNKRSITLETMIESAKTRCICQ